MSSEPRHVTHALGAVLFVVTGCSDCPSVALDPCIEGSVSLQQGVYGRVEHVPDTRIEGECPAKITPLPGDQLTLYVAGSDTAVANDVSDDNGIYELSAVAGEYRVCKSALLCLAVTVPMNGRVRADLSLPLGGFALRDPACPR